MESLPSLWLSDPAWCAMDATARGFHAQLVLLAAQQGGSLPDDEPTWRRWLGVPEAGTRPAMASIPATVVQWVNEAAPSRLAQLGGMGALMEHYWVARWLPMLRQAWKSDGTGRVSCTAALALAARHEGALARPNPTQAQHTAGGPDMSPGGKASQGKDGQGKPARKPARRKAKGPTLAQLPLDHILGPGGALGQGWTYLAPIGERLFDLDQVKARWHVPVSRAVRLNLWSVGLAALSTGPGEEDKNRAFLSSLIQKYGERKVAAAVGEMGGRNVPPADPRAFLRAILRRETEGSVAAQRARDVRAGIPL